MADSRMVYKVSPSDKHCHAVRIMGIQVHLWRLSRFCVLVAWLEVCQIVRQCLPSVGRTDLPSRLFLHKESGEMRQWRYISCSGYRKSARDLSEGQIVC